MKNISVENIIKQLKTSEFTLNCRMPLGYSSGLPILQIKNDSLCLTIPYLKYKVTGVVDKTLVYPIRYTISVELPENNVVGFSDLTFNKSFEKVDFNKPVGFFRHDSIKDLDKNGYKAKRAELMSLYGKLADSLIYGTEFTAQDNENMKSLLKLLTEPSLYPIYKVLDRDFYNRFLA